MEAFICTSKYTEYLGQKVFWEEEKLKTPQSCINLYEVRIQGSKIPWPRLIFYNNPDSNSVAKNAKKIIEFLDKTCIDDTESFYDQFKPFMSKLNLQFRNPTRNNLGEVIRPQTIMADIRVSKRRRTDDDGATDQHDAEDAGPSNMNPTAVQLQDILRDTEQDDKVQNNQNELAYTTTERADSSEPTRRSEFTGSGQERAASSEPTGQPELSEPGQENASGNSYRRIKGYKIMPPPKKAGVYVLKLDNDKYYVGQTNQYISTRIEEHKKRGRWSATFVKANTTDNSAFEYLQPKSYYPDDYNRWEEEETYHAMLTFGFNNVRGYVFAQLILDKVRWTCVKIMLSGRLSACYKCGEKGHLMQSCKNQHKKKWLDALDKLIETSQPANLSLQDSASMYDEDI